MMTRVAIACLALSGTAVSLIGAAEVRPEHPRIFITRATLPELKKRCETTHKALFRPHEGLVWQRTQPKRACSSELLPRHTVEFVFMLDPNLKEEFWRELELRLNYYVQGTMASPMITAPIRGAGSKYLRSARDSAGSDLTAARIIACICRQTHRSNYFG